jgi:hypothetical protein
LSEAHAHKVLIFKTHYHHIKQKKIVLQEKEEENTLVKALLRRQSNATSEWSHTCCLLQLEKPFSQTVTVTSFPLQSLTSRTKKSPSRFLSRVCFSERRKTGNQLTKSEAIFTTFSRR